MVEPETFHKCESSESEKNRKELWKAIHSGSKDRVKALLAKETSFIDILTPVNQNKTVFHIAIDEFELGIINLFLSQFGVKAFDDKYFLHYAVEENNTKVLRLMIANGFSLSKKNEKNFTPFCIALKNENLKVLDILLSKYSLKDIKANNDEHLAPAYIASICGNLQFIQKYVRAGLPINIPLKLSTDSWSSLANYASFTLLHLAVKNVKLKIVEVLLSGGADIFVQNENGSSPLHIAFEMKEIGIWKTWTEFHNNNTIIDLILDANTKLKSNPINKHGLSHFHIACSRDVPEVVEHFLKLGVLINQPVNSECHIYKLFSPLHFAAKFRCKKTMEVLLKNGANFKMRDYQKMTALHIAAKESCLEVIHLLLQHGADITSVDSHGNTPIHLAFKNKNYQVLDLLLSVPTVANSNLTNREGLSHFHIACTRNNVDVIKSFIEKTGKVIVDICVPIKMDLDENSDEADWSGFSPLHFAVSHNRVNIVELLLHSNANVGIKDKSGCIPFHTACQSGYKIFDEFIENILVNSSKQGKLKQLIQPFTDVPNMVKCTDNFSGSIHDIDWSVNRKDYLKIVNLLVKYGSDVHCLDNSGNAPVFYAYSAVNNVESVLEYNLDCSKKLVSSLSSELRDRRVSIISDLLKLNVNLDKCYKNDSILLYISSNYQKDYESYGMMKLFLKNGANVNVGNKDLLPPLVQATIYGSIELITLLLNFGANVDCIDPKDHSTPLLIALSNYKPRESYEEIIDMLLNKRTNPNARRSDGKSALHIIASNRSYEWILSKKLHNLMKAGANVNCQDKNGLTPLHEACESGNVDAFDLMLSFGADVNIEDNEGKSVCCYLGKMMNHLTRYEKAQVGVLYEHILKMSVICLLSSKASASFLKFGNWYHQLPYYENRTDLIQRYQREVKLLQDTKINDDYSLHDVIFKSENTMSRLVKNPAFKNIVESGSFNDKYYNYGYLIKSKYEAGENRAKLLPIGNGILSKLAGLNLPDSCTENICKHFTNAELRESIKTLSCVLNSKKGNPGNSQLRRCKKTKRQKVN